MSWPLLKEFEEALREARETLTMTQAFEKVLRAGLDAMLASERARKKTT